MVLVQIVPHQYKTFNQLTSSSFTTAHFRLLPSDLLNHRWSERSSNIWEWCFMGKLYCTSYNTSCFSLTVGLLSDRFRRYSLVRRARSYTCTTYNQVINKNHLVYPKCIRVVRFSDLTTATFDNVYLQLAISTSFHKRSRRLFWVGAAKIIHVSSIRRRNDGILSDLGSILIAH